MYYTNVDSKTPHMLFIGRWCPLHKGHIWIVEEKIKEQNKPVLILVRDTGFDEFPAEQRAEMVKIWMEANAIKGSVTIIPDIEGVYYGRGVGYNVDEIRVPADIRGISATKIRALIKDKDDSWKSIVAPGIDPYLERIM